jgi:hypothetical protein
VGLVERGSLSIKRVEFLAVCHDNSSKKSIFALNITQISGMSQLIKIDKEYAVWIQQVSERFRQSQLKAAVSVNSEMLRCYWALGADIITLKAESRWGNKFFENLSLDLQEALPNMKGLSVTNLGYMKRFYQLYFNYLEIHPQAGKQFCMADIYHIGDKDM